MKLSNNINLQVDDNLVPVCAWCNRVRDSKGNWHYFDHNLIYQSGLAITHSICDPCKKQVVQELSPVLVAAVPRHSLNPA